MHQNTAPGPVPAGVGRDPRNLADFLALAADLAAMLPPGMVPIDRDHLVAVLRHSAAAVAWQDAPGSAGAAARLRAARTGLEETVRRPIVAATGPAAGESCGW